MNKKILIPGLVLTVAGASLFAATTSFAQGDPVNDVVKVNAPFAMKADQDSLVQRIAEKFGLNKSDVQAVFDEHHKEMGTKMQARQEERLTEAVKAGKLTEEQKQKILGKLEELKAGQSAVMDDMRAMTPEQRREAFEKKHTELKTWAQSNNIPMEYLMFKVKMHGEMKN